MVQYAIYRCAVCDKPADQYESWNHTTCRWRYQDAPTYFFWEGEPFRSNRVDFCSAACALKYAPYHNRRQAIIG